ncbi:Cof-type HAD-IIB family hydrolase [Sporosarcina limicola]|uniref:Cof subfamily protein (Haloacid dehalogenase superfamily) n=1 Tax=Sporosarcina limicola TaxID=34101 RepID=A0A927MIK5_9BACL|nr:Cof-type HAD-IIB family hydrolase [Sporosarcina limicola]MBE1555055.1 Cof subfamily protein (haloacid dehalogenase superfamily) [Sporosarcina limicola]
MKPHLIVLDLDGTLLTDEKVISDKTLQTLKKAEGQGHHIMIATGRPYRASEIYYRQLGLKTPIVNFNGAFVHHPGDRSWKTIHETISLSVVNEVIEAMQAFSFQNIVAEVMDDVYMHYHDEKLLDIFGFGGPRITEGDIRHYLQDNPTSLLIQAESDTVNPIRRHLGDVHAEVIDHRRWGAPWDVIEIVRHGLNKAVGISHVSKWMDIPKERIIAFGDEDNDLEMIDYAGVGVAMGNGIDQLKSIADEVTSTNNEDGIARVLIERLHLN